MKVLVVGSGIAGLGCAYQLSQDPENEVVVVEARSNAGLDAASIDLKEARIDIPYRVFSPGYYPTLTALYEHCGIERELVDSASSFVRADTGEQLFAYRNAPLLPGVSLPYLVHPFSLRAWRFAWEFVKLRLLLAFSSDWKVAKVTAYEWLRAHGFSDDFCTDLLCGSMTLALTCTLESAKEYPAPLFLAFIRGSFMRGRGMYHVAKGTREVVRVLTANCTLLTSTKAVSVEATSSGQVEVVTESTVSGEQEHRTVDHVVVATEAPEALALLRRGTDMGRASPSPDAAAALDRYRTESSVILVHTDPALMPPSRSDWNALNFLTSADDVTPVVTIWMNNVVPALAKEPTQYFQTWRMDTPTGLWPDESTLIHRAAFTRPILDLSSTPKAAELLRSQQGQSNVWYCGSYSVPGAAPFLEAALVSGLTVAQRIGAPSLSFRPNSRLLFDQPLLGYGSGIRQALVLLAPLAMVWWE